MIMEAISVVKELDVDNFQLEKRGIWSSESSLSFLAKGDSTSRIAENGEESTETICLDEVVGNEKVTFIKMDIEGAEKEALIGVSKRLEIINRNLRYVYTINRRMYGRYWD